MNENNINNIGLQPFRGLFTRNVDAVEVAISYYIAMTCFYASFNSISPSIVLRLVQIVFFMLFFNAFPIIFHSITKKHIFSCFIYFFTILMSYIFAKDTEVFHMALNTIVSWCIPLFLLGSAVRDVRKLIKYLEVSSVFVLFFLFTSIFIFGASDAITFAYSQDLGYQALVPFIVYFLILVVERRKAASIGIALSSILILMGGARGPLLAAILSVLIVILRLINIQSIKGLIMIVLLIITAGALVYFSVDILNFLMPFFEKYGISTRVLEGLINQDIATDNSRETLRIFALNEVSKNPLYGTGVINDRRLIYDNLALNTNKTAYGYYSHNIFLEMLMQFGLIPGLFIFVITLVLILSTLSNKLIEEHRMVAIVFISIGLLPLLVSYSYVTYAYFYLLIGFSLSKNSVYRFNNLSKINN